MGEPNPPAPAMRLLAAFSRDLAAIDWARQRACRTWGPVAIESPLFDFDETDYYEPTMGPGLKKVFFAFAHPFDPGTLADVKHQANRWERQYADESPHAEPRPLNLDPGYLSLGKLVLASTKDFTHRIYLARGVYAEVTLYFKHGRWQSHEWTFADYRRDDYQRFFSQCRDLLYRVHRQVGRPRGGPREESVE